MSTSKSLKRNLLLSILLLGGWTINAQQAWFVDGYHGGVYGHYPEWQARFMVDKLTEIPDWKISLEIEPETWDTVSIRDAKNFQDLQEFYATTGRFGRIEFVNPTWAQPYCYNISGESIIRQFGYGIDKIKEYFPQATFTTYSVEEPCFTSSLPQILKGFNYKYAVLRNPNTCWGGYTTGFGKDLVNWIGPDGTTLLSVPRYACEELSETNTFATASANQSDQFIEACYANGIKYPVGMCFQDAGWKFGPWLGNAEKRYYKPTTFTTWTEYIEMVKDKVKPIDWNFSVEDVKPGLVWGAQVLQKLAQEIRVSENRLIMGEKLASLDCIYSGEVWPAADFAEAWRTLMLSQHHDCWIVPYNGKPGYTWADNVTRWTGSSNRIADEKIHKMFADTENTNTNKIRIFNTLGTTRTDLAQVTLPKNKKMENIGIVDPKGNPVPFQISANTEGNNVLYWEATIPGMGYATYTLKKIKHTSSEKAAKKTTTGDVKIETDYYIASISPAQGGTITSLVDKKNGNKELIEKGKALNNLRGYFYQEEKFYESTDKEAEVTIQEDGTLFTRILIKNEIAGNNYRQLVTFHKRNPRIDCELHIDWKEQPGIGAYDQSKNYKAEERAKAFYNDSYKLHLQFPFKGLGDKLFKNAPFDVCESKLDNTIYSSWDSIKHNVILNWVDVENQTKDYGVALFSDHTTSYLHTSELPLGLTVQYVGKALWGRNYKLHGPTHIRYALLPHVGSWEKAQVEAASIAWNEPFIANFINPGKEPAEHSLMECPDRNLHVSSVNMEGKDMLVRFYNTSSEKEQEVHWNCSADQIEQVDLYGNKISSVKSEKGKNGQVITKLILPQFGFQTLRLTHIKIKKH